MILEKAVLGAGCFWHIEHYFSKLKGVISTRVGYSGGNDVTQPTYENVCTGDTGHAEVVEITFNPKIIKYNNILENFWRIHDPCSLNKQGPDIGTQYRSIILTISTAQRKTAMKHKQYFNKLKYKNQIVTEITNFKKFHPAEEYHQKYIEKNPSM